jgi:branched-chain amino acid transport system substrate-binding protein
MHRKLCATIIGLSLGVAVVPPALAKDDQPGITDTQITIGQTAPLSGPASAYSVFPKTATAYFRMLNEMGGINGRKIKLVVADDGARPPKTVEQTRRLVEDENAFLIFMAVGTANSMAVRKYLNAKRVPQLFVTSGSAAFGNYKEYPWSIGWGPTFSLEGAAFATWLRKQAPAPRIALVRPCWRERRPARVR